ALTQAVNEGLRIESLDARPATPEELQRVHGRTYLEQLKTIDGGFHRLDGDTPTSPASVQAAYRAAGATVELATGVAEGSCPPGIAVVRPPGHHALPDRAMGFCLLNNVAVATRALQAAGVERVAIYDWDVHHGNGTQAMFFDDPNVLYMSSHQFPFYPGTGAAHETGAGPGEGATVNVPLPAGTGDDDLVQASHQILLPRVRDFSPDIILISAGFDPYVDDPLGAFNITVSGFRTLAQLWRDTAEDVCSGRIAAVLEGGYDLDGLAACVRGLAEAWDT
ncbi:MAG: histone deacetylase, partial [Myxococcota bacterium]